MSENLFKVGCVYRDGHSTLYRLVESNDSACAFAQRANGLGGWLKSVNLHRLADGRFVVVADLEDKYHLIPGELVQRDGQWVAADDSISFPSGSVLTTKGGYITGRTEPEPQRAPLPDSDAWRYTGKVRDDFADFTVNSSEAIDYILPTTRPAPKGSTLHAHPGMGAALLRG